MAWTRRDELPAEVAVFPLPGALLLPRGKLPLNIFEARYLAMIEDALGDGRVIGMIQPEDGSVEGPNGPLLYRLGCLGRISSFSETDDGRFLITLSGLCRFRVQDELSMRRGYRRVALDAAPFRSDLAGPPDPVFDRNAMLDALRAYFNARGFQANWTAIEDMDGDTLITTLSMVCPFEPVEKQALLQAADSSIRADTLRTLLEMGAHSTDEPRIAS